MTRSAAADKEIAAGPARIAGATLVSDPGWSPCWQQGQVAWTRTPDPVRLHGHLAQDSAQPFRCSRQSCAVEAAPVRRNASAQAAIPLRNLPAVRTRPLDMFGLPPTTWSNSNQG